MARTIALISFAIHPRFECSIHKMMCVCSNPWNIFQIEGCLPKHNQAYAPPDSMWSCKCFWTHVWNWEAHSTWQSFHVIEASIIWAICSKRVSPPTVESLLRQPLRWERNHALWSSLPLQVGCDAGICATMGTLQLMMEEHTLSYVVVP